MSEFSKQTSENGQKKTTHIVLSDELHQDVSHQRLPVFRRQPLLQGVPEEEVSLQELLHKLHVRLTEGWGENSVYVPEEITFFSFNSKTDGPLLWFRSHLVSGGRLVFVIQLV